MKDFLVNTLIFTLAGCLHLGILESLLAAACRKPETLSFWQ
ncbi:hypothetical protein [uncultured Akkermansia sp.]|nr:hypothetical protein [uncultured Akkermansia sp.]